MNIKFRSSSTIHLGLKVFNLNQALWTPVKTVGKVLFRRGFPLSALRGELLYIIYSEMQKLR